MAFRAVLSEFIFWIFESPSNSILNVNLRRVDSSIDSMEFVIQMLLPFIESSRLLMSPLSVFLWCKNPKFDEIMLSHSSINAIFPVLRETNSAIAHLLNLFSSSLSLLKIGTAISFPHAAISVFANSVFPLHALPYNKILHGTSDFNNSNMIFFESGGTSKLEMSNVTAFSCASITFGMNSFVSPRM